MNTERLSFFSGLFLLLTISFSFVCTAHAAFPGEVASVNGQGISFRELESRRALLFAGTSPKAPILDDSTLQVQYRYVLGKLIEEAVICQYMESKGLALEDGAVEAEERRIRGDYPEASFDEMLSEQGLSLESWRAGIYRRLLIDQFVLQVLRPEISIAADEVEQYYREHSDAFVIPEQWHFLQIAGPDKKDVELARDSLIAGTDPTAAQKEFLVTIHDIRMGADLLPEELLAILAPLQRNQASKAQKWEGEFRVFVLLGKTPAGTVDAAEISKRVEQALSEEKMRAIYAAWMEKRLGKANIRIAAVFAEPVPLQTPAPSANAHDMPALPAGEDGAVPPAALER